MCIRDSSQRGKYYRHSTGLSCCSFYHHLTSENRCEIAAWQEIFQSTTADQREFARSFMSVTLLQCVAEFTLFMKIFSKQDLFFTKHAEEDLLLPPPLNSPNFWSRRSPDGLSLALGERLLQIFGTHTHTMQHRCYTQHKTFI